jgi:hypothetical protein
MKSQCKHTKPYFLWDYDLTEDQIRKILHGKNIVDRQWMMARILSSAHFNDVWKYLTLKEVAAEFPYLRMRSQVKEAWQRALNIWGCYVKTAK